MKRIELPRLVKLHLSATASLDQKNVFYKSKIHRFLSEILQQLPSRVNSREKVKKQIHESN